MPSSQRCSDSQSRSQPQTAGAHLMTSAPSLKEMDILLGSGRGAEARGVFAYSTAVVLPR